MPTSQPSGPSGPANNNGVMHDQAPKGRTPTGLYPHVSRTKLAKLTGLHLSTVAGILHGRTKVRLELAVVIAREVGVTMEQLNADMVGQQRKYRKQKSKRTK